MRTAASRGVLGLAVGLAVVLAPSAGGAEGEVHIRQVVADTHPTMSVTVSAGQEVGADEITLTENGRPVRLTSAEQLAPTGEGIDVVLAIDTSDSVRGKPLATALAAAKAFLAQIPPRTGVGILTFSNDTRVVLPVTTDHVAALEALERIEDTQHRTKLYDAVVDAATMFGGTDQRNLILLTDGADLGSEASRVEAIEAARKANVAVYGVGLGSKTEVGVLEALASQTQGIYTPADEADLVGIYQTLASRLGNQFILVYRSASAPGTQVTIDVAALGTTDRAIVLVPRDRPLGGPSGLEALLRGWIGLVVVLGLAFLSAFLLVMTVLGSAMRARRERTLAARLNAPGQGGAWPDQREEEGAGGAGWIPEPVVSAAERVAKAGGFLAPLERKLERAGMPVRPGEVVAGCGLAFAVGALLGGVVLRSPLFGLVFGVLLGTLPYSLVSLKMSRRVNRLHEQLPDILMILASSLRAGHSFLQSLDMVAKEIGEPAAPEFARLVTEIRLGRPMDEAMNALADRVGTEEFKWAILAVNVQREVGGNLAEILDTVAETVRERETVRRQVKVLSGEGRLSMWILCTMPFLIALYVLKINYEYMSLLWTTGIGLAMLFFASLLMFVGVVWSRKLVKIDV